MADEVENKPKFILNKQKNDTPSGEGPSKPAQPAQQTQQPQKVVVHKQPQQASQDKPAKKVVVVKKKPVSVKPEADKTEKTDSKLRIIEAIVGFMPF